jgi:hypothetical protein
MYPSHTPARLEQSMGMRLCSLNKLNSNSQVNMSDPTPYIATIKHLYSGSVSTNTNEAIKEITKPTMYRTWSGTYGDGNIVFSLPKEGECLHGSSKFLCVFCEKLYDVKPTTEPSKPDCSVKTGLSASPPLSLNATSETHSASWTQFLGGLVSSSPSETKSDGRHSQPDQNESLSRLR